jgi:hypothetical protein
VRVKDYDDPHPVLRATLVDPSSRLSETSSITTLLPIDSQCDRERTTPLLSSLSLGRLQIGEQLLQIFVHACDRSLGKPQPDLGAPPEDVGGRDGPFASHEIAQFGFRQVRAEVAAEILSGICGALNFQNQGAVSTRRVRRHPRSDHGIGRVADFRASRP